MRFRKKIKVHYLGKTVEGEKLNNLRGKNKKNFKTFTKREFEELIFESCFGCGKMSIPQGIFATRKVRQNNKMILTSKLENKEDGKNFFFSKSSFSQEEMELSPLQYNSKLMNSIWGLYNRYSKHNFKKIIEANGEVVTAAWGVVLQNNPPLNLVNKAAVKNP